MINEQSVVTMSHDVCGEIPHGAKEVCGSRERLTWTWDGRVVCSQCIRLGVEKEMEAIHALHKLTQQREKQEMVAQLEDMEGKLKRKDQELSSSLLEMMQRLKQKQTQIEELHVECGRQAGFVDASKSNRINLQAQLRALQLEMHQRLKQKSEQVDKLVLEVAAHEEEKEAARVSRRRCMRLEQKVKDLESTLVKRNEGEERAVTVTTDSALVRQIEVKDSQIKSLRRDLSEVKATLVQSKAETQKALKRAQKASDVLEVFRESSRSQMTQKMQEADRRLGEQQAKIDNLLKNVADQLQKIRRQDDEALALCEKYRKVVVQKNVFKNELLRWREFTAECCNSVKMYGDDTYRLVQIIASKFEEMQKSLPKI